MSCIFLKVILTRHDDCYQGVDDRVHPNHQYSIQSEVLVHYPPVIGYSVSRSNFTSNHISILYVLHLGIPMPVSPILTYLIVWSTGFTHLVPRSKIRLLHQILPFGYNIVLLSCHMSCYSCITLFKPFFVVKMA